VVLQGTELLRLIRYFAYWPHKPNYRKSSIIGFMESLGLWKVSRHEGSGNGLVMIKPFDEDRQFSFHNPASITRWLSRVGPQLACREQ